MSDRAAVPAPPVAGDPVPYRPVSGLAIAGLAVSGLFAVWVLIAGLVAFRADAPFLMDPIALLVPLAGFGLSLVARIQIRRSEGTRAGLPLATWGLWLSVLAGLGYLAYRGATELALRQQAEDFSTAWFELLRGDDVDAHAAFWGSLDPSLRDQRFDLDNPEVRKILKGKPDEWRKVQAKLRDRFFWGRDRSAQIQKGSLPNFFMHDVVANVRQAGTGATVTAQGIRSWDRTGDSYKVEQNYRITTLDAELDATVTLLGSDDKDTGRRRWRVLLEETGIRDPRKLTPRGQALAMLRGSSQMFAADWAKKLLAGQVGDAYLDTAAPEKRNAQRLAWLLPDPRVLPGHAEFMQGRLLQTQELVTFDPTMRDGAVKAAQRLFQGIKLDGQTIMQAADTRLSCRYELDTNTRELRFLQPFDVRIPDPSERGGTGSVRLANDYRGEMTVVVATRSAAALAAVEGAGPSGLRLAGTERNVSWWIAGMTLDWVVAVPKTGRPGP